MGLVHSIGTLEIETCTWTIDKFSSRCCKVGEFIASPTFAGGNNLPSSWFLRLYPNGITKKSEGFISLYVWLKSSPADEVEVICELSIINQEFIECNGKYFEFTFRRGVGYGYSQFVSRKILVNTANGLLKNGTLTLHCKLSVRNKTAEKLPRSPIGSTELRTKFWDQCQNEKFVDVTFNVNGKIFKLHKCYLAARCPLFYATFMSEMQTKNDVVTITDAEPEEFEEFVKFLYLGKTDKLKKYHYGLLAIAEKYGEEDLKEKCERSIHSDLNLDNAVKSLRCAHLNKANWLKNETLKYMKTHAPGVVQSEGRAFLADDPELLLEFICSLTCEVQKSS